MSNTRQWLAHILGEDPKVKQLIAENTYLREQLDGARAEVKALEEKIAMFETSEGAQTALIAHFSKINHYLFGKNLSEEIKQKAEFLFDILFESLVPKTDTRLVAYEYHDNNRESVFYLSEREQTESLQLKTKWVYKKYPDKEKARQVARIYETVKSESMRLTIPVRVPEKMQIGKYLVSEMITGPSLHQVYQQLNQVPLTLIQREITLALLRKQLYDTAFIRTRSYSLSDQELQKSDHVAKMMEVIEMLKPESKNQLKAAINGFRILDDLANYYMRDAASWNFKLTKEGAGVLLSPDLQAMPFEEAVVRVKQLVEQHVVGYDLDKLSRLTFQQDDAMHVLESSLSNIITDIESHQEEANFVKLLIGYGEDISRYWETRDLAGAFRHPRTVLFYEKNQSNYPDPDYLARNHHLRQSAKYFARLKTNPRSPISSSDAESLEKLMIKACSGT